MNVLNDLLLIKKFREEKAEMALSRARADLHESEIILDRAKNILKEHILESKRKEESLFSDLYIRLVRLKDLDSVALDINLIKEETVKLENKLSAAKDSRESARVLAEEAKNVHCDAVRVREKFTVLVDINNIEKLLEAQRLEDLELEEAGSSRHSRLRDESIDGHLSVRN